MALILCALALASVSNLEREPENVRVRYKNESEQKSSGAIFTPKPMARTLSSEMITAYAGAFPGRITVLDPAVGEAELLVSFVEEVRRRHPQVSIRLVGFDINSNSCEVARRNLVGKYPDVEVDIRCGDFLSQVDSSGEKYDFVIANPPYIRTQILGSEKAQALAKKCGLSGRVDIYYSFLVTTGLVLAPNGVAGYITSNKFLSIKSGAPVRKFMQENYRIFSIRDYGDTHVFENAAVLPCTIVFGLGQTSDFKPVAFTTIYEDRSAATAVAAETLFDHVDDEGAYRLTDGRTFMYRQGCLNQCEPGDVWSLSSNEIRDWLRQVDSNTWMRMSDLGKIRVGIKTTADNVFIGDNWGDGAQSPELLKPLVTHRDAGKILPETNCQWKVLYPHRVEHGKRKVVEIDEYPKSKKYLERHRAQLEGRKYVIEAGRRWYEIWVPQNPGAWEHRKIVFRDISETPQFWYDDSGAVVNGDCYWIDIDSSIPDDLVYLALAVANSSFIEKFYDLKFNTKLYSGKRRFMAQYVEQFPLPSTNSVPSRKAISLVAAMVKGERKVSDKEMTELNGLVDEMFMAR